MLRYRVLGPLEVADEDRPIAVPSVQQRLLLSMLLLEAGRTVPASSLIDGLWSDRLPTEPAAALRTQVSRLRSRLGAGGADLVTGDEGYRLDVGEGCLDAQVFERLLGVTSSMTPLGCGEVRLWANSPTATSHRPRPLVSKS